MSPLLKKLLIGLLLVIVIGGAVMYLGKNAPAPATGLVSSTTGENPIIPATDVNEVALEAQQQTESLVLLLQKVNNITLDTSIFDSPDFVGLKDLASPLAPDRNPGRSNPFLPIGSEARVDESPILDAISTVQNSSTQTQNSVQ